MQMIGRVFMCASSPRKLTYSLSYVIDICVITVTTHSQCPSCCVFLSSYLMPTDLLSSFFAHHPLLPSSLLLSPFYKQSSTVYTIAHLLAHSVLTDVYDRHIYQAFTFCSSSTDVLLPILLCLPSFLGFVLCLKRQFQDRRSSQTPGESEKYDVKEEWC